MGTDSTTIVHPSGNGLNRRDFRRNFAALVWDYAFFGVALAILNPSVLPPDFVARIGGGPVLVGLAGLVFRVTWLVPQLMFAAVVNHAPRKKRYVIIPGIPGRIMFIPAALLMMAVGPSHPGLLIVLMLGSYVALALGDGMSAVAWMDVIGSSLNPEARGRMIGVSQAVTGMIVALTVSPLVRFVLGGSGPTFPSNYALLLIIASVLLLLGLVAYGQIKEGNSPPPEDSPGLREYRRFLGRILRENVTFRQYIIMRFIYDLSSIGMPFYIVFATRRLGLQSAVAVSDQILLVTISSIAAALVLGRVNERAGSRNVILIATCMVTLGPLLIISTHVIGVLGLHLLWIVVGVVNSAFVPGFLNWVVEYAPEGYRPIYSGLSNTFGVLALLAPLAGGVIVEEVSYEALFVVAAGLGAVALLLALRLPEPRHGRTVGPEPVPVAATEA